MQLMIDTAADPTDLLRRAAKFLTVEADARDADEGKLASDIKTNTLRIPELLAAGDSAPAVDTAAIFGGAKKLPAGLDGHGENKAPPPPPLVIPVAPVVAPTIVAATVAPVAAGSTVSERDSSGIPFDARIHQTAKGKKTDGTWKLKKGLDPTIAAAVTAELRGTNPAPAAAAAPPPPPVTQVAPPPPVDSPVPTGQPAALSPGAPTGVTAFRVLMQTITANTNTGKLTNDEVDAALKSVNLPPRQLISLVQNPDKVAGVAAYIDAVLAAKA